MEETFEVKTNIDEGPNEKWNSFVGGKRPAFFMSRNLIGDGLYISGALNAWYKKNPDRRIFLTTHKNFIAPIYERMGVPLTVVFDDWRGNVSVPEVFDFDVNEAFRICDQQKIHIAEAYAQMLEVELEKDPKYEWGHLRPIFIPTPEELEPEEKGLILCSFFSASCASRQGKPPNKMLPWHKVYPIIRWLETLGSPVRFLGSMADRLPHWMEISSEKYLTAIPLNRLALIMREARCLVTLDNGMSHLAASQQTPTFLFYPQCLGTHYILPKGNRYLAYMHMDPVLVSTSHVIEEMKRCLPFLIEAKVKEGALAQGGNVKG